MRGCTAATKPPLYKTIKTTQTMKNILLMYYDGKDLKFEPFQSHTKALLAAEELKKMDSILKISIVLEDGKGVVIK